jgi:predicted RNase H-like HicB family nuclease
MMRTYIFPITIKPDEYDDGTPAFGASCAPLNVHTWGDTYEEAYRNIQGMIAFEVESRIRSGEAIPVDPAQGVLELATSAVAVQV